MIKKLRELEAKAKKSRIAYMDALRCKSSPENINDLRNQYSETFREYRSAVDDELPALLDLLSANKAEIERWNSIRSVMAESSAPKDFASRLRKTRETRELSQSELAREAGMQPSAIAHFEAGRRKRKLELNSQEIEELAQWIETLPVPNYDRDNADAVAKVLRAEALQASLAVAREVLERAVAELKECAMDCHRDPRPLIAELDALLGDKP